MKLKKAESEMLPVWVLSGVYTKPFFAWLNEAGESNTWEHQNNTVGKMRQGNFIYLYLQKGAGKNLVPGHDLKFAGKITIYMTWIWNLLYYLAFRKK